MLACLGQLYQSQNDSVWSRSISEQEGKGFSEQLLQHWIYHYKQSTVWLVFFDRRTSLEVISVTLTVQQYVHGILQLFVSLFLLRNLGFAFRHHDAQPHTTPVALNWAQAFSLLSWSDISPDLSFRKHI